MNMPAIMGFGIALIGNAIVTIRMRILWRSSRIYSLAGEIYINDELLWRDASLVEPISRSWNMPRLLRLSEPYLRDGINSIRIRVVSIPGQQLGLGRVFVGSAPAMRRSMTAYGGVTVHSLPLI